jgi:NAD(P)-dependent dehydrogenase (short-subunit alcohol dehydrogenase family)
MGTPLDDIAPVVEFLLGDGAQFMSGATVPVNGGRAMP